MSHYSIKTLVDPMFTLRNMFADGEADPMNFCLFSTSGVHGSYTTIEDAEKNPGSGVTVLVVHPRIVCLRYGVVFPESKEDFSFLKKLRASSWAVVSEIGADES